MSGKKDVEMSAKRKQKSPWWQLYVMLPVLAGLFLGEMRLGLTGVANVIAQLAILFLVFGSIQAWIRANHRALMEPEEQAGRWQLRADEAEPAQLRDAREAGKRLEGSSVLRLPEAGLKSVLGTTFEMDESERLAYPIDSELSHADRLFKPKESKDVKIE